MYVRAMAVLLVVLVAVALAQWTRPAPPPAVASTGYADLRLPVGSEPVLASRIGDLDLRKVNLLEAIDSLAARSHANMMVRWGMLAEQGVGPATLVSVSLRDTTLAGALRGVLFVAGPGLRYGVRDGVIVVSAEHDAPLSPCVYDARPVLPTMDGPLVPKAPRFPPDAEPDGRRMAAGGLATLADSALRLRYYSKSDEGSPDDLGGRLLLWGGPTDPPRVRRMLAQLGAPDFLVPLSSAPTTAAAPPQPPPADPNDIVLKTMPELRLDQVTLEQALDIIRERWKANIVVRWSDLGPDRRKAIVDLRLWDVRLSQALSVVLDATMGNGFPAQWHVQDGVITIDTAGGASDSPLPALVRVFDVRDLIAEALAYRKDHPLPPPPPGAPVQAPADLEGEAFCKLIAESLQVDSQSLNFWCGRLVVTGSPEVHQRIETFLTKLRSAKP